MILQTLIFSHSLHPETLVLGADDNWQGTVLYNLKTSAGKGGFTDLVLNRSELASTPGTTDLLLTFNEPKQRDQSGNYAVKEHPEFSSTYFKSGGGSATFDREHRVVLEADRKGSLFSPHTNWEDFTIEFWLYPANPKEGESIIQWKGLGRKGEDIYSQSILCHFTNRRLVWSFSNIFQMPDSPESYYEISGDPILPRQWNHHMLRYDSHTGMLEYLINGQPSAIIYTTDDGNESNTVYTPRVGDEPGELVIGEGMTGFLDEFRIERMFLEDLSTKQYKLPGYGISPVLDLKFTDSRINSLTALENSRGNSAVFPYYFTTNSLLEAERIKMDFSGEETVLSADTRWKSFDNLNEESRGRYLLLAFLMYPDMKEDLSPGLSFLEVDYTPSLPPLPPAYIFAETNERGEVRVEWNPSASPDVAGYLLFFGENPGEYIYPGSPLKIEKENYTLIEGLSPFKQYFFAVKSYTDSESPRYSDFSEEISIRP